MSRRAAAGRHRRGALPPLGRDSAHIPVRSVTIRRLAAQRGSAASVSMCQRAVVATMSPSQTSTLRPVAASHRYAIPIPLPLSPNGPRYKPRAFRALRGEEEDPTHTHIRAASRVPAKPPSSASDGSRQERRRRGTVRRHWRAPPRSPTPPKASNGAGTRPPTSRSINASLGDCHYGRPLTKYPRSESKNVNRRP